jgi:hypothetical protein
MPGDHHREGEHPFPTASDNDAVPDLISLAVRVLDLRWSCSDIPRGREDLGALAPRWQSEPQEAL